MKLSNTNSTTCEESVNSKIINIPAPASVPSSLKAGEQSTFLIHANNIVFMEQAFTIFKTVARLFLYFHYKKYRFKNTGEMQTDATESASGILGSIHVNNNCSGGSDDFSRGSSADEDYLPSSPQMHNNHSSSEERVPDSPEFNPLTTKRKNSFKKKTLARSG